MSTFLTALSSLRTNRMRAALTMLGVVIGVAAVLAMIAVAEGTSRSLKKEIESIGSNLLLVRPGVQTSSGARMGSGSVKTLSYEDALALSKLDSVQAAAPTVRTVGQAIYKNMNWSTSVLGTSDAYAEVREWSLESGRFFGQREIQSQAKVCLIGNTVKENLFLDEDPLGKIIRINRLPFKVIGVLEEKGPTPHGRDQDDVIMAPLYTVQRKIMGVTHLSAILIKAAPGMLDEALAEAGALLRDMHRIPERGDSDFTVRNLAEMLKRVESASRTMGLLLGAVASISLFVGGIGIMNIMLVSVTERTREIGLRRAVGAKKKDIERQFLIEALILCGLGGAAGVVLGITVVFVLERLSGVEAVVPLWAVTLSFTFSLVVGVVFGFYPAKRAAAVEPIEALGYE